jgi:hypothetical protein
MLSSQLLRDLTRFSFPKGSPVNHFYTSVVSLIQAMCLSHCNLHLITLAKLCDLYKLWRSRNVCHVTSFDFLLEYDSLLSLGQLDSAVVPRGNMQYLPLLVAQVFPSCGLGWMMEAQHSCSGSVPLRMSVLFSWL